MKKGYEPVVQIQRPANQVCHETNLQLTMQIQGEPTAMEKGESFGGVRERKRALAW